MISFEVMLSCAQARLYFGQDLNRGHVLISLPYLRILFCSFCLDVILHLLYFGFSFRAVSPLRAGYFSLMACDNTQDCVAQIAREVPNYSQVLFPKDVPTLEVRFQVFGKTSDILSSLRTTLTDMCSSSGPFILIAEIDEPETRAMELWRAMNPKERKAKASSAAVGSFCVALVDTLNGLAPPRDFIVNCVDIRAIWYTRIAVNGTPVLRYALSDSKAMHDITMHACDALSQMSCTETAMQVGKCFLGQGFPSLIFATYSGGPKLREEAALNTFTGIFPGYLILLKRVGTEHTRDDSLLLFADAPHKGGVLCLRRPLDSLILPAEKDLVCNDASSLGMRSLGLDPAELNLIFGPRDWCVQSHCMQGGNPRKKRTSTAHLVQRTLRTPGPSECISTVAPVLDKPPVRMDESARAAKEVEEEVCRSRLREIDEANLVASQERQDRRTAAQRQRRAATAADKKMRQRRQQ